MMVGLLITACKSQRSVSATGLKNPMAPLVSGSQTPTSTATPTVTSTPHCGFTVVNINAFNIQSSPTPIVTVVVIPVATPIGTTAWYLPTSSVTPNTTPVTYGGQVRVIRTLVDWQNLYGSQTPPVDFSTQLILQAYVENDCFSRASFQQVCEDPNQVTATLFKSNAILGCNMICYMWISAVVDQSNLPVVWQVVSP
jgi:hypothetical protein